jgi:hypothetical protein
MKISAKTKVDYFAPTAIKEPFYDEWKSFTA